MAADTDAQTATATGPNSTIQRDLQAVASDLDTMASASASGTSRSGSSQTGGPPPGSNDTSNIGTNGSETSGTKSHGYTDSYQQQFALSAYSSSTMSGLDGSATSSLSGIHV